MSGALVHNAYPELPELAYLKTTLPVADAVARIQGLGSATEIKRATYVIFCNESGNGRKGINNNYIGLQADGGRLDAKWTPLFAGTCVLAENQTGKLRRFICFKDPAGSFAILADRVEHRGLYVGGTAHPYANVKIVTKDDWPGAYYKEWVRGDAHAVIPPDSKANLLALYAQAAAAFP